VAAMNDFELADSSVIKSIRQRDLYTAWLRCYLKRNEVPPLRVYLPNNMGEEMPDLVYYDVKGEGENLRFLIVQAGERLAEAVGNSGDGEGVFLDRTLGPIQLKAILPLLLQTVRVGRPVYTIAVLSDVSGAAVTREVLFLPFGANGKVTQLVSSHKSISEERRFELKNILKLVDGMPKYSVRCIIDCKPRPVQLEASVSSDIVAV
jgi:hypothetical protein